MRASVVATCGLVALWHVEPSQTRNGTCVLCVGRQIFNHRTTREVLKMTFRAMVMEDITTCSYKKLQGQRDRAF